VKTLHYQSARGSVRPGDLRPNVLAQSTLLIPNVACTSSAPQRSRSYSHSNADQAHCLAFTDRGSGICSARSPKLAACRRRSGARMRCVMRVSKPRCWPASHCLLTRPSWETSRLDPLGARQSTGKPKHARRCVLQRPQGHRRNPPQRLLQRRAKALAVRRFE
jgi:hypothetical protein